MILRRFYDPKLAQASYLIGCGQTGEAIVFDPTRDADQYIAAAAAEGVRISYVTETHIHADFVSGSRELAERANARLLLSDEGGPDWRYAFAKDAGAVLLKDGTTFKVGNVKVEAVHTPGHTPEHLAFLITDTAGASQPIGMITGDFVFVGDVGRPDLLEKAASKKGTMDAAARKLFQSLQRFKSHPDYLQIWPGHGAGSACGKDLSAIPHSTVGYEKLFNWAFAIADEDAFVSRVLEGQPEPPRYFAEMKRVNRDGPRILKGFHEPARQEPSRLGDLIKKGAVVIDTRSAADYASGFVPGTINIPLNKSFPTWAGWLIPYTGDVFLIADDTTSNSKIREVTRDLAMIGLDKITGYFGLSAISAWTGRDIGLQTIPQVTAADLAKKLKEGGVTVVDVRAQSEWDAGHIPGATHIPLGHLAERAAELPKDRPLVMQCQGGGRSSIAASVLRAQGFSDVSNLAGGLTAWEQQGGKLKKGEAG